MRTRAIIAAALALAALAVAADGGGTVVWANYPDLRTSHYGAISVAGATREAIRLPFAIDAMAQLPGGRAFVLGAPAGAQQVSYAVIGPGARATQLPIAVRYPSQRAVVAANAAGTTAILGESGAQAVLTICDARARCGATVPLTGSQGTIGEHGKFDQSGLAVAIGPDGRVLAVFLHNGRLVARRRAPGGRLGPLLRVATPRSQVWLAAALSSTGRGEIAWETQNDGRRGRPLHAVSPTTIASATATAGGAFSAPVTLDGFPASDAVVGPADATLGGPVVIAAAFDGARPLVAWTGHAVTGLDVRVADADDPAGTTQTLSDPSTPAALGALATAPGQGALIAWSSTAGVQVSLAASGDAFGAPSTLAASLGFDASYDRPVAGAIDPATGTAWVAGVVDNTVRLWRSG